MICHYWGRKGELAGRVPLSFGSGRVIQFSFSSVMSQLGRQQPSLFLPLFVADRLSRYVFVIAWFLWGLWFYFLFFVHSDTHGHLSSGCPWLMPDWGSGSWGMGRLTAPS